MMRRLGVLDLALIQEALDLDAAQNLVILRIELDRGNEVVERLVLVVVGVSVSQARLEKGRSSGPLQIQVALADVAEAELRGHQEGARLALRRIRSDPRHLSAEQAVDPTHGIEQEAGQLAPRSSRPGCPVVPDGGGRTEQGLAQGNPAGARVHPVVDRGAVVLPEELPHEASEPRERRRLPHVVAVRAGRVVVRGSVERVHEHVRLEAVRVPLEPLLDVAPPGVERESGGRVVGDVQVEVPGDRLKQRQLAGRLPEALPVTTERRGAHRPVRRRQGRLEGITPA